MHFARSIITYRQYGIRVNAYSVCSDGFQCFLLLRLVFLAQETGACLDAVLIHFGGSRNRTLCIALYHKRVAVYGQFLGLYSL